MTRKEQLKQKEVNSNKKIERTLMTLQVFVEYKGKITDEMLADKLQEKGIKTSSSTVGRDLKPENLESFFIEQAAKKRALNNDKNVTNELSPEESSIVAFVKKKRIESKKAGNSRGGLVSSRKSNIEKEKNEEFNECARAY